jgi:hypothetical protein
MRRQLLRFVLGEWRKIHGCNRATSRASTPAGADWIAFRARGHDEKNLAVRDHRGDLAQSRELIGIRPMHVFDNE